MGNIKLDLKGFKFHSTDGKSTTLHHEKHGHKLTLAHNVLSKDNQSVLKAMANGQEEKDPKPEYGNIIHKMADGGEAPRWDSASGPEPADPHRTFNKTIKDRTTPEQDKQRDAAQYKSSANYRAANPAPKEPEETGYTNYAKGGDILDSGEKGISSQGEAVRSNKKNASKEDMKYAKSEAKGRMDMEKHVKPNMKGLAEGGEVSKDDNNPVPEALRADDGKSNPNAPINLTINTSPQPQQAPNASNQPPASLAASPDDNSQDQQDQGQDQSNAPQAAPAQPVAQPQPQPSPQQVAMTPSPPPSPVQDQNPTYQNAYNDYKAKHMAEFAQENAAFEHDLANGHITPETYHSLFAKKDTLGKLGTIFGMLLGGAGSGLTHQPNALLQMMQNQIDNDLKAQIQSKENAQNFLKMNQNLELAKAQTKQINTETQAKAYALSQAQMLQSTYHSFVDKVNKMPEGPQKDLAKQQLGIMYNKMADRINNINDQAAGASAYYNTIFGSGGQQAPEGEAQFQKRQSGLMALGPEGNQRAQYENERHFPGLPGQASVPLSGGDREEINSGMTFDQKLRRFIDWTKQHSGDLNPKEINEGKTLAAELQGAYRMATHGGVYKEGEQNFISKLIDEDPTKFFNNIRVLPQLNALAQESKSRIDQKVKSLGFKGYEEPVYHKGAQYKKVPGGYQKVK